MLLHPCGFACLQRGEHARYRLRGDGECRPRTRSITEAGDWLLGA